MLHLILFGTLFLILLGIGVGCYGGIHPLEVIFKLLCRWGFIISNYKCDIYDSNKNLDHVFLNEDLHNVFLQEEIVHLELVVCREE